MDSNSFNILPIYILPPPLVACLCLHPAYLKFHPTSHNSFPPLLFSSCRPFSSPCIASPVPLALKQRIFVQSCTAFEEKQVRIHKEQIILFSRIFKNLETHYAFDLWPYAQILPRNKPERACRIPLHHSCRTSSQTRLPLQVGQGEARAFHTQGSASTPLCRLHEL